MTTTTTETHRLYGSTTFAEGANAIRALLFGKLADLAWPVVEHYRSDLFHDAAWVAEHVNGPTTFYFVVREWGTHIGSDWDLVRIGAEQNPNNSRAYRVNLWTDGDETANDWRARGSWFADITPMEVAS